MSTNVGINITGNSQGAERAFSRSAAAARAHARELERQREAAAQLGGVMMTAGALMATGLGLSAVAAVQWESAFAGVKKTVDGTPEQIQALDGRLRDMAKSLPASHREIAAVAEAAGQLGVKVEDVAGFTRVMVDMGESTNLSATDAATGLARFSNIMGTATSDADRLGSAIVELGNNNATTEQEILDMSLRLAGAGRQINLTEGEVLGIAASLSSVGIEAEAGGSAFSKAMLSIDQSVRTGGDSLDTLAEVAGMSSEQFVKAYEEDAGGAITSFVEGLGEMSANGENTVAVLDELGFSEIRMRDALLRASSAGDLMRGSLEMGNQAWEDNNALVEEAARRYETTEAKMQMAKNTLYDAGITVGQTLLPAIAGFVETGGAMVSVLSRMPEPVQATATVVGAVAAAIALSGGAALVAAPKIVAYDAALGRLGLGAFGVQRALTAVSGLLLGPYGGAILAAATVIGVLTGEKVRQRQAIDNVRSTLDEETGAITDNTRALQIKDLQERGALDMADRLGVSYETVLQATLGNADAQAELADRTAEVREAAAQLRDENGLPMAMTESQEEARGLLGELNELNKIVDDSSSATATAREEQAQYRDAMYGTGEAADETAGAEEELAAATSELETATTDAETAMNDLKTAIDDVFVAAFGTEAAVDAYEKGLIDLEAQVKAATEAGDENAASLDGNSASALANRDAMRRQVEMAGRIVTAMAESGASSDDLKAKTNDLRDGLIRSATQMGFSEEAAERYADELLGIVPVVSTTVKTPGMDQAITAAQYLQRSLDAIPSSVSSRINVTTYRTEVRRDIAAANRGPVNPQANGGIVEAAANGLFRESQIVRGGQHGGGILWGEPETGWEAYISGKPGQETRNASVLAEAASRLGYAVAPAGAGRGTASPVMPSQAAGGMDVDRLARAIGDELRANPPEVWMDGRKVTAVVGDGLARAGFRGGGGR